MQGDDRPVARVQTGEGLVEQLAVGEGTRHVVRGRCVDRGELDLDDPTLAAADEVETGIDEQSMEPGVEPLRVTETGQITPGADERLLDRVARELRVAEDQPGGRVQPREPDIEERSEGLMIASLRSVDAGSLVHG